MTRAEQLQCAYVKLAAKLKNPQSSAGLTIFALCVTLTSSGLKCYLKPFEIIEEGYAQRWLELRPEDRVTMRDGSVRTAST